MKSWGFAAFLISVCAFAACGDDQTGSAGSTTSGSGAAGGAGGDGGGAGGPGGNGGGGGDAGGSPTSSSSSGPATCDDSEEGCGIETATGCYTCALKGACKEARDACVADDACVGLVECLDSCAGNADPAACAEECRTNSADGVALYDALTRCVICDECPTSCGADDEPLCQED